jgi:hypothetical protein
MLSRKALEDFDTFLPPDSRVGGSGGETSEPVVDVADETLETVEEGEVKLDEKFDDGFRVFLMESGG